MARGRAAAAAAVEAVAVEEPAPAPAPATTTTTRQTRNTRSRASQAPATEPEPTPAVTTQATKKSAPQPSAAAAKAEPKKKVQPKAPAVGKRGRGKAAEPATGPEVELEETPAIPEPEAKEVEAETPAAAKKAAPKKVQPKAPAVGKRRGRDKAAEPEAEPEVETEETPAVPEPAIQAKEVEVETPAAPVTTTVVRRGKRKSKADEDPAPPQVDAPVLTESVLTELVAAATIVRRGKRKSRADEDQAAPEADAPASKEEAAPTNAPKRRKGRQNSAKDEPAPSQPEANDAVTSETAAQNDAEPAVKSSSRRKSQRGTPSEQATVQEAVAPAADVATEKLPQPLTVLAETPVNVEPTTATMTSKASTTTKTTTKAKGKGKAGKKDIVTEEVSTVTEEPTTTTTTTTTTTNKASATTAKTTAKAKGKGGKAGKKGIATDEESTVTEEAPKETPKDTPKETPEMAPHAEQPVAQVQAPVAIAPKTTEAVLQPLNETTTTAKGKKAAPKKPAAKAPTGKGKGRAKASAEEPATETAAVEAPVEVPATEAPVANPPVAETSAAATSTAKPSKGNKRKSAAGAQEEPSSKRHKSDGPPKDDASKDDAPKDPKNLSNRPLYDYYCMPRPFFDVLAEARLKEQDEEEMLDEDVLEDTYYAAEEKDEGPGINPLAEWPDHKWFGMWHSWCTLANMQRFTSYRCPDNFSMYIYNDFYGQGIQEVIENQIIAFNEATHKTGDDKINGMWSNIAGLIHWMHRESLGPYYGTEDSDRHNETAVLIGSAILATLNELDLAGLLKPDSRIKDLSLIMALALNCMDDMIEIGVQTKVAVAWRHGVVAYAKKGGIDLRSAAPFGTADTVKELEEQLEEARTGKKAEKAESNEEFMREKSLPLSAGEVKAIKDCVDKASEPAKSNLWSWAPKFKKFKKGKLGGESYNILWMTRAERKTHSFSHRDPLAQFTTKDLREGNIMLG